LATAALTVAAAAIPSADDLRAAAGVDTARADALGRKIVATNAFTESVTS